MRTTGGTGGGGAGGANNQARVITAYNTSTLVATVVPNWETTPDSTTTYDILATDLALGQITHALRSLTYAEPGQGAPAATTSMGVKLDYVYKFARNKITDDGTNVNVYSDDTTTIDQKAAVSKSGGTVTRGEFGTGA